MSLALEPTNVGRERRAPSVSALRADVLYGCLGGAISPKDLDLFRFVDSPEEAFSYLKEEIERHYLK